MPTPRDPDAHTAHSDITIFAERGLDPDTAVELLDELTHDTVSHLATDANNTGIGAQVALLIEHLGHTETLAYIHRAAKAHLADLLDETIISLQQVQKLVRRDHLDPDDEIIWNRAVSGLGSLAEAEKTLHAFTELGRESDQHLVQLWQRLTARYREGYRDRAHLLALIAGLLDLLADHDLATRVALVQQPVGKWPILVFELPPIDGAGPHSGMQITRHIAPDDLHLFGPAIPLGQPAPVWDGSDTSEHHHRIRAWLARLAAAREADAGAGCECGEADRGAPGHDGGQAVQERSGHPS